MPWYAVDALDEALDETKSLLLPFDLGTWVRLAIISLFAGLSTPQTPTFSWDVGPGTVRTGDQAVEELTDPEFVALALGIAGVLLVVAAVFAFVGSVMEFVLVDVVRSRNVRILSPFRRRLRGGLQLFLFRAALVVVMLLTVGTILVPIWLAAVQGTPIWLLLLVVTVPLTLVVGLLVAGVSEFTTAFVVPLMTDEEVGLLAAWRAFWPTLKAEWKQFAVYVLVKLVVLVGAGFLLGIAGAIVAVPLGVFVFAGAVTPLAFVAVGVAALLGLVLTAAVSVPVVTYLRYHSLCTLDASAAEFSLR